jgi:hypothetical protein
MILIYKLAFLLNRDRFLYLQKKRMTKRMGIHSHWNSNIPITQTANSHKSETLLASRNTSHNPKHFSQSETLLANRNTSCPHRDLNPGLITPQFTALSTRLLAAFFFKEWKKVILNHKLIGAFIILLSLSKNRVMFYFVPELHC